MKSISWEQKLFTNPFARIVLGLLVCFGAVIIGQEIAGKLLTATALNKDYRNLIKGIIVSLVAIGSYTTFFKFFEKRAVIEISTKSILQNLSVGIIIGVILQCLTILVIYLNNSFKIVSVNPVSFTIIPLSVAFTVAIIEEILMRGILFRITEEKLGSNIALVLSAIVFGALHLLNSNSSLVSASCVGVEAGLLFGAAYIYARNLWFPIAIHFAWNFVQSGIFGAVTSGNKKTGSLFSTEITGPRLITGGEFGPEATIQAIIFCTAATIILMYVNKKQHKLIKPYWKV